MYKALFIMHYLFMSITGALLQSIIALVSQFHDLPNSIFTTCVFTLGLIRIVVQVWVYGDGLPFLYMCTGVVLDQSTLWWVVEHGRHRLKLTFIGH